jgi:hypothetical protein
MNCDRFAESLADFLERDVPDSARAAIEAHALSCSECGPLLADLRRLRIEAANLPELAPSRDLWSGIAARIETPIVELGAARRRDEILAPSRSRRAWQLGLAAAALVGITATVTHEITKRSVAAGASGGSIAPVASGASKALVDSISKGATDPAQSHANSPTQVAAAVRSDSTSRSSFGTAVAPAPAARLVSSKNAKPTADQTYDSEIAKLRAVLNYRRHDLDSSTVAVVDKNLKIIDEAISQCRLALKKDPASRFLLESLNDALDTKVQLLRTAATLPSRT